MDIVNIDITEVVDDVLVSVVQSVDAIDVDVSITLDNILVDITQLIDNVDINALSTIEQVLISINEGSIVAGGNYTIGTDWMALVRGYNTIPSFNTAIAGGDVYDYMFDTGGPSVTYYRYIATDMSIDGFYQNFDGSNLTNLITQKKITI